MYYIYIYGSKWLRLPAFTATIQSNVCSRKRAPLKNDSFSDININDSSARTTSYQLPLLLLCSFKKCVMWNDKEVELFSANSNNA